MKSDKEIMQDAIKQRISYREAVIKYLVLHQALQELELLPLNPNSQEALQEEADMWGVS